MLYRRDLSFGLDISDLSAKVMQLRKKGDKTYLAAFGELALPEGLIVNGIIRNEDEAASRVKELIRVSGITGKNAVVALPESQTFLKMLSVPGANASPARKSIEQELIRHLPYEIKEVWWDFTPVEQHATSTDVLAGAAARALSESYRKMLIKAGLLPVVFDLEALAIARALVAQKNPHECVMIVNLGQTKSVIIVARQHTVLFTADGRSSAGDLTKSIAASAGITFAAAEEMKQKRGLDAETKEYAAATLAYVEHIAERVSATINFATTQAAACPPISRIILSGGGALLKRLPEALTDALKIPVRLADPWINTRDSIASKIKPETGLRMVTATGLALAAVAFDHSS